MPVLIGLRRLLAGAPAWVARAGRGRWPTAVAAALVALAVPAAAPAAANLGSRIVSGLPWRSGASAEADFGAWRGRELDVRVGFVAHDNFAQMRAALRGTQIRDNAAQTPQVVVSLAMLPRNEKGRHGQCAAGAFDDEYREFGRLLTQAGAGRAVVRLGWEANAGPAVHPWGFTSRGTISAYVQCFRRQVRALRSTAPNIKIEWTNAKKGKFEFPAFDAYPGNDVVDIIGVHQYDTGPRKATQAVWNDYVVRYNPRGGPWGLATWLEAAKVRGKKLAISEWCLWDNGEPEAPDNAVYIENMHRFLRANASHIAYENYYNRRSVHEIYPSRQFPRGRTRYRSLWSPDR